MVYIVSDERIATENFEQGKIYKVDFVDESFLYGVCIGIGSDFVMLSGDISGYIFPLTMQTASQVSSIDLYDPTPPEPPVPWTNLLQYQTGVLPFEFTTTDTSLFSWYIEGEGVGDKTKNLFNEFDIVGYVPSITTGSLVSYAGGATTNLIPISDYNVIVSVFYSTNIYLFLYDENENYIGQKNRGLGNIYSYEIEGYEQAKYARIRTDYYQRHLENPYITLTEGTTAPTEFIPYGYKIPVICNEHTTNIYLDAPLAEGEILYSTDIDTAIVTDIGDNELTVGTTQQPTSMQIVYKIADR